MMDWEVTFSYDFFSCESLTRFSKGAYLSLNWSALQQQLPFQWEQ